MSDAFTQDHPEQDGPDARGIAQAAPSGASDLSAYTGESVSLTGTNGVTLAAPAGVSSLLAGDNDGDPTCTVSLDGTGTLFIGNFVDADGGVNITAGGDDTAVTIAASGADGRITADALDVIITGTGDGSSAQLQTLDTGGTHGSGVIVNVGAITVAANDADSMVTIQAGGQDGVVGITANGNGGTVAIEATGTGGEVRIKLRSPDGSAFLLSVANDGTLSAEAV